jgi:hypothetical protein
MSMPSKIQLLSTLKVAGGGKTAAPPFDVDGGSDSESCPSEIETPEKNEIHFFDISKACHNFVP